MVFFASSSFECECGTSYLQFHKLGQMIVSFHSKTDGVGKKCRFVWQSEGKIRPEQEGKSSWNKKKREKKSCSVTVPKLPIIYRSITSIWTSRAFQTFPPPLPLSTQNDDVDSCFKLSFIYQQAYILLPPLLADGVVRCFRRPLIFRNRH